MYTDFILPSKERGWQIVKYTYVTGEKNRVRAQSLKKEENTLKVD